MTVRKGWLHVRGRCEAEPVCLPVSQRCWVHTGNVLLAVPVTALQLAASRAGSPVRAPVPDCQRHGPGRR